MMAPSSAMRACVRGAAIARIPPTLSNLPPAASRPSLPHFHRYSAAQRRNNSTTTTTTTTTTTPTSAVLPFQIDQFRTVESGQLGTISYSMHLKLKRLSSSISTFSPPDQNSTLAVPAPPTAGTIIAQTESNNSSSNSNEDIAGEQTISFWHDVVLDALPASPSQSAMPPSSERFFHFVNEIPMGTKLKMEVNTKREHNPIQQDLKNNNPRVFMYGNIPFNYGCFPQTWENPEFFHPDTKCGGDNYPVDVVELGNTALPIGKIARVKILGSFALIDGGETDWKILVIREDDPIAPLVNDIDDVQKKLPAKLETIYNWYRYYKTAEGKPENRFALDGRPTDKKYAIQIVEETHAAWKELLSGQVPQNKLWIPSTTVRTPTNTSSTG